MKTFLQETREVLAQADWIIGTDLVFKKDRAKDWHPARSGTELAQSPPDKLCMCVTGALLYVAYRRYPNSWLLSSTGLAGLTPRLFPELSRAVRALYQIVSTDPEWETVTGSRPPRVRNYKAQVMEIEYWNDNIVFVSGNPPSDGNRLRSLSGHTKVLGALKQAIVLQQIKESTGNLRW